MLLKSTTAATEFICTAMGLKVLVLDHIQWMVTSDCMFQSSKNIYIASETVSSRKQVKIPQFSGIWSIG
jgi:hypothetical protein